MQMKIFRTDPDAALQAAQADLQAAERRIGELQIERAAAIEQAEGGEYVSAVAMINTELAHLGASVVAHGARVVAMKTRCHQQVLARREQDRQAGIADVRKRLGKRSAAARKLDTALAEIKRSFAELMAADEEAFSDFPPSVSPLGRLAHFRLDGFQALSAWRRPQPPSAGIVRRVAELDAFNFADAIEARNREVIEMLESSPLPADEVAA